MELFSRKNKPLFLLIRSKKGTMIRHLRCTVQDFVFET
jgi:hypothetical protein